MKTFREYIEECNKLLSENPKCGDFPAIYAKDSEGNGYDQVSFSPSLAEAKKNRYSYDIVSQDEDKANAVIIN